MTILVAVVGVAAIGNYAVKIIARSTAIGGAAELLGKVDKTYQISFSFEVDGEEVSGRSTFLSTFSMVRDQMGTRPIISNKTGSAVLMPLRDGRVLAALLITADAGRSSLADLVPANCTPLPIEAVAWLRAIEGFQHDCSVGAGLLPVLVLMNAPETARGDITYVDLASMEHRVRFVSGTIRFRDLITADASVDKVIPWIKDTSQVVGIRNSSVLPRWLRRVGIQMSHFVKG